jgi:electron transfer flavoprotein beta subunit
MTTIGVAMKWVPLRFEVDPLSGAVTVDDHDWGASAADLAALECGLRLAEAWDGEVVVATAGPAEAEAMLRDALASGAQRAVRVEIHENAPSATVAAALADVLVDAEVIICGDASVDRGSGAVPAFLAARLGAAQALGLIGLQPEAPGAIRAQRRLDGGRREELRVAAPTVLSVEGSLARLRRAPLSGVLRAREAEIIRRPSAIADHAAAATSRLGPYRPRARILPVPTEEDARQRILAVTGTLVDRPANEVVTLDPPAAADRFLEQLRAWGYLE